VRVLEVGSDRPVEAAQVIVTGTTIGGTTNTEGRLLLRGIAPGSHTLRVLRVGYSEVKRAVTVQPARQDSLEISLSPVAVSLSPVVTTATGATRRVELGNTVATIAVADKVDEAPIKNIGDVLVAKAPGVQVLPANMTAGGNRVRIRGTSSISLSNDPIYIIDGIRMTSGANDATGGSSMVGGTRPNRASDINPDEIENIEIVKGPSAATLYGTDAANGVIVITTKRGRAGQARWTFFGDYGVIDDRNDYPTMHAILGHAPATPTVARKCLRKDLALGTCIMDSTTSLNVFATDDISPIKDGWRAQAGAQVSGGSDALRYFLSGDVENEVGPFGLPDFERDRFNASKVTITDYMERPNTLDKASFRANLGVAVGPTLDLNVNSGFTKLNQRLPQVDNNVNSFWYNGTVGQGYQTAGPGYTGVGSLGQPLRGYANFTPGDIFQNLASQGVQRFIGSTNANWRPKSWFEARADVGIDLADRVEMDLCKFDECADFGTQREGGVSHDRATVRNITTNLVGTATWQPRDWLNLKATAGAQYVNFLSDANEAGGEQLPPGARTPDAGTIQESGSSTVLTKTLGVYVETQGSINDRLFLTAAVRTDQNSAFGTNFQRVYYPKGSLSWVISEEEFFPAISFLDEVRLRVSGGASGVQPGPNDALRTFAVTTTSVAGDDVSGLQSDDLGNLDLKPERSTEYEAGIDSRLLGGRLSAELTYYRKRSKDALIDAVIAPSAGTNATNVIRNLGSVKNWGYEALISTQVIERASLAADLTVSASHNSNKLITLGTDASGRSIPTIGTGTVRQTEGYPINGYWTRHFTWADENGDGIIVPDEVEVDTAFRFLGYSQPRLELSITGGLELFNRRVRLTGLVDHKSGYYVQNTEQSFLCQQSTSCKGTSSLDATLFEQARAVAIRDKLPNTPHGYFEQPDFWRIREVTATYTLSETLASRLLRGRGASFTLAVRNLKVFSDWTGVDPEQNYGEGNTQSTLLTAGPPMYWTLRANLRY
jgi:TonB-linked SusC/RagA family outer membrane protein